MTLTRFQVLQEKFTEFASETGNVGQERVTAVNQMVDELIDYGHSEAATIAEWKDGVNEAWADLLELMETRAQMLAASHQLHKFFFDCREVMHLHHNIYPTQHCSFFSTDDQLEVAFKVFFHVVFDCFFGATITTVGYNQNLSGDNSSKAPKKWCCC